MPQQHSRKEDEMSKEDYSDGNGRLDLGKIMGSSVVKVVGYTSSELGDPVFKISYIEFADGAKEYVEGAHDFPYVAPSSKYDLISELHQESRESDE
jgi:hypothetical protein